MKIDGVKYRDCVDSRGRSIYYSSAGAVDVVEGKTKAFVGSPFVTLEKGDAEVIVQFLIKYVGEEDDLYKAFGVENGDMPLAFERLVDRVVGFVYPKPTKVVSAEVCPQRMAAFTV